MPLRERVLWALCLAACVAMLIAPAVWNQFPLLQYDTGGYLARWYEGTLVPSRAVAYGLILTASAKLAFWPALLIQSALTVWILALTLRAHGFGNRPLLLTGLIAALSFATTLPWLTSILLTDIFCGLGVLALYLLLMRADAISRLERYGLIALVALAAATHSATLAVLLALLGCAALLWLIDRARMPLAHLAHGVIALALGAAIVFAANYAVAKRLAWTPGGFALSFGRMLQDGIVNKYLDDHCPAAKLKLCAVKDELPRNADEWFWGSPLFDRLGRFAGLGAEMEKIAVESMIVYPGRQLQSAIVATGRQLIDAQSGEGVLNSIWHTYGIIERFTPQLVPAMRAARQQQGELSFEHINALHYPIALIAMAMLPVMLWLARRRTLSADIGELAAATMLALLANAFVCGALSNPHDRYGARIIWLAALAGGLALVRLYEQHAAAARTLAAGDILPAPRQAG